MKNKINVVSLFLAFGFASSVVFADQRATLTCTGEKVILEQKSPYLGDDSNHVQSLYIMKSVQNNNGSRETAYFLDVFEEGATGTTILTGHNEVGGFFQLEYKRLQNVGDESVIHMEAPCVITYSHGSTLNGTEEVVHCVLQ